MSGPVLPAVTVWFLELEMWHISTKILMDKGMSRLFFLFFGVYMYDKIYILVTMHHLDGYNEVLQLLCSSGIVRRLIKTPTSFGLDCETVDVAYTQVFLTIVQLK